MSTLLDGATDQGEANTYPSNPGQFAARWNSWTEAQRAIWLENTIRASENSLRCYMLHDLDDVADELGIDITQS